MTALSASIGFDALPHGSYLLSLDLQHDDVLRCIPIDSHLPCAQGQTAAGGQAIWSMPPAGLLARVEKLKRVTFEE
jgi:hypothetical protein